MHAMTNPTTTAMALNVVAESPAAPRGKKNPVTKLIILINIWPIIEHQKAVLKEN
jgi:hypothetical protein